MGNLYPDLARISRELRDLSLSATPKAHAATHGDLLNGWRADCERAKVEWGVFQGLVKEAAKDGLPTPPLPEDAVDPVQPQRRRLLVQDSTPEKLAEILSGNPGGTLHLRDELAGWLTSFDRYTPGGREFWLEAYGGRPFVIDRKSNPEPTTVPFNGVSVVGGIQPEKLADALLGKGKPDDGLVARFLWTWPDRADYQRPRRATDHAALESIYSRLDGLSWGIGADGSQKAVTLLLDAAAADIFEQFERANREAGDEAAGLYKSFCGKLPGMVLRLALVIELAGWAYRGGVEPQTISAKTIAAVAEFVDEYAKPMAMRVFGDAVLRPVERNAATLARLILKHRLKIVNARDLKRAPYKQYLPGMREADPLNDALAFLVEADWLKSVGSRAGDRRPWTSLALSPTAMIMRMLTASPFGLAGARCSQCLRHVLQWATDLVERILIAPLASGQRSCGTSAKKQSGEPNDARQACCSSPSQGCRQATYAGAHGSERRQGNQTSSTAPAEPRGGRRGREGRRCLCRGISPSRQGRVGSDGLRCARHQVAQHDTDVSRPTERTLLAKLASLRSRRRIRAMVPGRARTEYDFKHGRRDEPSERAGSRAGRSDGRCAPDDYASLGKSTERRCRNGSGRSSCWEVSAHVCDAG